MNSINPNSIPLHFLRKSDLIKPCDEALIIKVFDKRVGYKYLIFKLNTIWKVYEDTRLMYLGNDFSLVRFSLDANYHKTT